MRRITQEEFDSACVDNKTKIISDCTIGEEIVFPKEIGYVHFIDCVFEKPIKDITFYGVLFNRVEVISGHPLSCADVNPIFTNCKFCFTTFKYCDFSTESFTDCMFGACRIEFCTLCDSEFIGCSFQASGITFRLSDLNHTQFRNIDSCGVVFDNCDIERCSVTDSDITLPQMIPSDGPFIAWKKAIAGRGRYNCNDIIVKLRIPEDSKRCCASHKCRASKAEVLGFETLDGRKLPDDTYVRSWWNPNFTYKIGIVEANSFDDNPTEVCSNGIHFFLNRDDAVAYEFT